jgi:hypothetical protein
VDGDSGGGGGTTRIVVHAGVGFSAAVAMAGADTGGAMPLDAI